ncbi:hypothetical protein [Niallia sp. BSM11]
MQNRAPAEVPFSMEVSAVVKKIIWFFSKVDAVEQDILLNEKY